MCGWLGGGSVVSCSDLWVVACLCVGENTSPPPPEELNLKNLKTCGGLD